MPAAIEYESSVGDSRGLAMLPDHSGKPQRFTADFFVQPPVEIGQILSAESTLKYGAREMPLWARAGIALAVAAAIMTGGYFLSRGAVRTVKTDLNNLGIVFAILSLPVSWYLTRFRRSCSYVGNAGVARFTLSGRRTKTPVGEVLLFSKATELRVAQTRHSVNGMYSHTSYNYFWSDASGLLFRCTGKHKGNKGAPKQGDPWHFARAAEIAWSDHLLGSLQARLAAEGSIPFRVDNNRWVRVGPGFLEFHFGETPVRVTREEIAGVSLGSGEFSFKHKDAKWYSSAGKFKFKYGTMANAQLFLVALDRLMGYRWS
jgi:hypothetical protein